METELEKLEKQRKDLFNERDLLREFETESMIDCLLIVKLIRSLVWFLEVLANIATLHCDQCSLRCNRFLQYYDRNKLIFSNNLFKVNPKYEQKIKEQVISIDKEIKIIEYNNGKEE